MSLPVAPNKGELLNPPGRLHKTHVASHQEDSIFSYGENIVESMGRGFQRGRESREPDSLL